MDAGRVFFWTESEFIDDGLQLLFTMLITVQFVVIVLHDPLDIPGWTNGTKVREVVGRKKLWLATAINAVFPGLAVAFAIYEWNGPRPAFAANYYAGTRQVLPPRR